MNAGMIDKVHYTQNIFRLLMDAMARPGSIVQLEPYAYKPKEIDYPFRHFIGVGLTLLDQEVSFHVHGANGENGTVREDSLTLVQDLQLLTRSRTRGIEFADYVFVPSGGEPNIDLCQRGELQNPDQSATIVYELEEITIGERDSVNMAQVDESVHSVHHRIQLSLQGPGILGERMIQLHGLHESLLPKWQACNHEFPLGLDFIFVDRQGRACCIPRSSLFQWEVL
ncbi:phosphonate C-P lyase system protein PhnH [Paenibacillus pini]|uniref:PhnH protein n=1 Tax=Paenibacillus pini JCM 16418 TaxID=1236976 RepID=W7YA94_9BACL|nr:phosphonate C-P lyase system protein PhnH [Paenibacillus pini]GAF07960.1 PhnH protein [Paenibacillus pini JCM 16418]